MNEEQSFMRSYAEATAGTEIPDIFNLWAGLSVISSVASRRYWIKMGRFRLNPNIFVVLVGRPGNGKSEAKNVAEKMVQRLNSPVGSARTTLEALTLKLGDKKGPCRLLMPYLSADGQPYEVAHCSIFANELLSLLGKEPAHMIGFLTDVWDHHEPYYTVETKTAGIDKIPNPFVNLLGCMTSQSTRQMVKNEIVDTGFSRRTVFVWREKKDIRITFPDITPEQRLAAETCIQIGKKIMLGHGEIRWTDEAKVWFDNLYQNFDRQSHSPALEGYYETRPMMTLKIAMLIAIGERDMELKVQYGELADELLRTTEEDLPKVFEISGSNPQGEVARIMRDLVERQALPIPESKLMQMMFVHGDKHQRDAALAHLISTGILVRGMFSVKPGEVCQMIGNQESIARFKENLAQAKLRNQQALE